MIMSMCDSCPIVEKLHQCCGRHPMTGERAPLVLDDGTMVVVENGRKKLNHEVSVTVTSVLQTTAGRMIFARLKDE